MTYFDQIDCLSSSRGFWDLGHSTSKETISKEKIRGIEFTRQIFGIHQATFPNITFSNHTNFRDVSFSCISNKIFWVINLTNLNLRPSKKFLSSINLKYENKSRFKLFSPDPLWIYEPDVLLCRQVAGIFPDIFWTQAVAFLTWNKSRQEKHVNQKMQGKSIFYFWTVFFENWFF